MHFGLGLGPVIVSTTFLIIILMIYQTKEKAKNLESRFYNYLIINSFIFCIVTFIYVILLKLLNIFWVNTIIWRIYCALIIAFWQELIIYIIVVTNGFKNKKLKDLWDTNLFMRILFIVFCINQIVFIIMPSNTFIDKFDPYNTLYTTPALSIIQLILVAVLIIITLISLKKNENKVNETMKKVFYVIFINALIIILQVLIPTMSLYSLVIVDIICLLYLFFENPDVEMKNELRKAQNKIKESSRTKTSFLTSVTEEIKTPVNYITTLCKNLEHLEEYNVDEVKKIMEQIILSSNNLLETVNNVLDISKIESGKMALSEKEYKIKELIDDITKVTKSKLGEKPIGFEVNISPNLSTSYKGDSVKLFQSVLNLLTNAIKYTEVGKITFDITSTKGALVEKLLFKVSDTGNGIKEEDHDKIFIKGTRLDYSIEDEFEGNGYGLPITKEFLELMDGKIWFESQHRVGTTFYIEIPQKVIDSTPISETYNQDKIELVGEIDCSDLVALVVDDNKLNVKVIKRLLEKYKFKVVTVASGQDCIYKIKGEDHFDIIFMDQVMPDMTGIDTLKALKGLNDYELPPIILLTANAVSGMKERYLEAGFDEYISKPINTPELERILNKYFKKTN